MGAPGNWFSVLEVLRVLSDNGKVKFTSSDLVKAASFQASPPSKFTRGPRKGEMSKGSTAIQIASGWLSKFVKWGYVEVVGKKPSKGPKPTNIYDLTEKGVTCELRSSRQEQLTSMRNQLESLVESVNVYRDLRGKPAEGQAWKDLLKVARDSEEMIKSEEEPGNA